MSELANPSPEDEPFNEYQFYQDEIHNLYTWVDDLSTKIDSAPNPRPGIVRWFATDVPCTDQLAFDCNGEGIEARTFQAELHEQDSAHQIWEVKITNGATDDSLRSVSSLIIKNGEIYDFVVAPIQTDENVPPRAAYKRDWMQAWGYAQECISLNKASTGVIFNLWARVKAFYDGYDSTVVSSPEKDDGYWYGIEKNELAESEASIPGIAKDGKLLHEDA